MRIRREPSLDPASYAFAHRLRTRFAETDAMGIIHHGAYLPYLEAARVEWLRAIEHPYESVRDEGVDFAVVEVLVRYLRPLRFDEEVDVHVGLLERARASFQLAYLLTVEDERRATAVVALGAVDRHGRPTRLPTWVHDLEVATL